MIPNYNTDFDWTRLTIDSYANPDTGDGGIAIQNRNGTRYLTVTGLADGQEATVTVITTNPGYFDGTRTITGRALDPAYNPQFGTAIPGDGSLPPCRSSTTRTTTTGSSATIAPHSRRRETSISSLFDSTSRKPST